MLGMKDAALLVIMNSVLNKSVIVMGNKLIL